MSLLESNYYISDNIQIPCWILTVRKNGHEQRWYKAKEIAQYLRYDRSRNAILRNVPKQWRTTWSMIRSILNDHEIEIPPNWQLASQFITEEGIYQLIFHSTKRLAKSIQNYICKNILTDKFAIEKHTTTSGEPFKNTNTTAEITCCAQAEVTIHEQREQIIGLEEQLQTANDQINNLRKQLQFANNTAINEATHRAQAEVTINEQLGQMNGLKEQLQTANNQMNGLKEQLQTANNQMNGLKEQLQIVNNYMDGLREQLQTANNNADNEATHREQAERIIYRQWGEMNGMAEQLQNANNATTEETARRILAEETMNRQLAEINSLRQTMENIRPKVAVVTENPAKRYTFQLYRSKTTSLGSYTYHAIRCQEENLHEALKAIDLSQYELVMDKRNLPNSMSILNRAKEALTAQGILYKAWSSNKIIIDVNGSINFEEMIRY